VSLVSFYQANNTQIIGGQVTSYPEPIGAAKSDVRRNSLGGPGTLSRSSCTGDHTGIFTLGTVE